MNSIVSLFTSILTETLWPTRCVLCDAPNDLLCSSCWKSLPFIDQYDACPTCGAVFGRIICCECNPTILKQKHITSIPLDTCASLLQATTQTLKLITAYKDRNEQRLAHIIALLLKPLFNPDWPSDVILTTIPARKKALATRGFDHMALIAHDLSKLTDIPYVPLLLQKEGFDQRGLSAQERLKNKKDAFSLNGKIPPPAVIIIDDVFTTGATLYAAAETLKAAGTAWVAGLTLLQV